MQSVRKNHLVAGSALTLILMIAVPAHWAQAQSIMFENFNYMDAFANPDQAAFELAWPIDGSCRSHVISNDFSRQTHLPMSLRQDMAGPGTLMVKDIRAGAGSSSPAGLRASTSHWSKLYFAADDGVNGVELWKTSGFLYTQTSLVIDLNPGAGSSSPANITNRGSPEIYFTADDGTRGVELWTTNGNPGATLIVKDIVPGSGGSSPANLTMAGTKLFFTADNGSDGVELYSSSGTEASTDMIKDINLGATGSSPSDLAVIEDPEDVYTVYFAADDGTNGRELWKSDGTSAGTVLVKDINPGASGSSPSDLTIIGGGLMMFAADDGSNGRELWVSDGTAAGTSLVKDVNPGASGSTPANLVYWNALLYFTADDGTNGNELWQSDGSGAGTVLLKDINPGAGSSSPAEPTALGTLGTLVFTADDGSVGRELWKTDGTGAGTVLLKDVKTGLASSSPAGLSVIGTGGPTQGNGSSVARVRLLFSADDGISGNELWGSDGTTAGTALVKDIVPGAAGSSPANLYRAMWAQVGPMLFFSADDGTNGRELWQSDGTDSGIVGSGNKRDLVPLIQNLDASKSAVIGTDANPISIHFRLDLPSFGYDNQWARQSTWIMELTDGVDRAPVGPVSMVDCGGGVFRPKIPLTDGSSHNVFAIGVIAQLDQNPCDIDPDVPDFSDVPVVAEVVVYDGAQWQVCTAGKFGLAQDALVGKRWNIVNLDIKTNTIDISWECRKCVPSATWTFTVPRQYLGGFNTMHFGNEDCLKSPFDNYLGVITLDDGELVASPDPDTGACCFSHTSCQNKTSAECATAGGSWQGPFTACGVVPCCPDPSSDYDFDGDVDSTDFSTFQLCYTGSGAGSLPGTPVDCSCFDRPEAGFPNGDLDVDELDFDVFNLCASGPAVPADPNCD